jgi:hypothetical protein
MNDVETLRLEAIDLIKQILSGLDSSNIDTTASELSNILICLKKDYAELATILTDGKYDNTWTHDDVMRCNFLS